MRDSYISMPEMDDFSCENTSGKENKNMCGSNNAFNSLIVKIDIVVLRN